jgi:AraC-like DNA-binding protein
VAIVGYALEASFGGTGTPGRRREVAARQHELAMRARMQLARDPFASFDLGSLARALEVSPFHLCRVFRAVTGSTMHAWQMDLRLRAALEHLEGASGSISRVAYACGFSSHSHFVLWCRRRFGAVPSLLSAELSAA